MNDRRAFTALLFGCTTISLAGNVAYTVATAAATPVSITLAAVAPILLPVGVHYIPKAARVRRGARFVVTVAVLVAAVAAFVLSFEALSGLMRLHGHGGWTAYLLPIAVDVLAAAAAYALVVDADGAMQNTEMYQPVRYGDAHGVTPVQTAPPAATQPVESATLRDLVTASTPDPEPTSAPAHREAERDADTDEIALTSNTSREAAATDRDVELPLRRLGVVPAPRRDREAERDVARSSQATSTAAQGDVDREVVRDVKPEPAAKQPPPLRDVEAASTPAEAAPLRDAHRDLAQRVIDAGRTTVAVEDTAAVITAKTAGLSNKKVSAQTGVSESQVQRIWTAARELEAEPAPVA